MSFFQNPVRSLHRSQPRLLDIHEEVERSSGFHDRHPRNRVDSLDGIADTLLVFLNHRRLNPLPVTNGIDGSPLGYRRCRKYHVFVDGLNGGDQIIRCDDIAHTPAGHGEILGERIDGDGPLPHARQGHDRHEFLRIAEAAVNIISDHQQIISFRNFRHLLQRLPVKAVSRWVVRRVDDDGLGPLCDQTLQSFQIDLKAFLFIGIQHHRNSPRQLNLLRIRCEVRCMDDDLIPVIQNGFQRQVHSQASAGSDENFFIFHFQTVIFPVHLRDGVLQFRVAAEIRVFGVACLGIGHGMFDNLRIGDQIGISQTQIDTIVKTLRQGIRLPHGSAGVFPVPLGNKLMFHNTRFL